LAKLETVIKEAIARGAPGEEELQATITVTFAIE
jgi:hypothetical protein